MRQTPLFFTFKVIVTFLFVLILAGGLAALWSVFGETVINITLTTNPDLERGLVGHWTFDGSLDTQITDRSGAGLTAYFASTTATTSATVAGRIGQGVRFDGVDDYVDVGNAGTIRTIAFWAKAEDSPRRLLNLGGTQGNTWTFMGSTTIPTVGNSSALAALNGTDVAFIDNTNDDLRTYRWNGSAWTLIGSELNIADVGRLALAALNGTDVAFIDNLNDDLRTYRWNGSTWTFMGETTITGDVGGNPALAALNGTDVAFIDASNDDLRTYRWDGSTWTFMGSTTIPNVGFPALAALNGTDVAFIDSTNDDLRTYRWDGSTWTFMGSTTITGGDVSVPALAALNGTDVAFIDSSNDDLRTYRWDGSTWTLLGSLDNIPTAGNPTLAALNGTDVAFIDSTNLDLRTYQFNTPPQVELFSPVHRRIVATGWPSTATVYIDGAADPASATSSSFTVDDWHHVIITDATGVSAPVMQLGGATSTGATSTNALSDFFGILDDVRIYNRELSAEEIKRLYQLGATTKVNLTLTTNPDLERGLVGHWTFDGADMDTASNTAEVLDRSVNGNNGDWRNHATTTRPGKIGQALEFDGVDDYVDMGSGSALNITSDVTISAWIKADAWGNDGAIIRTGSGGATLYTLDVNNAAQFRFYRDQGINDINVTYSLSGLSLNVWYHVVGVSEGGTGRFYLDGVLVATESGAGTNSGAFNNLCIGAEACQGTPSDFWDGLIDDVRIYDRVLSAEEITRLYQLGATTKVNVTLTTNPDLERGLVGHWTFDGSLDAQITDRSSNGKHGYLFGVATSSAVRPGKIGQALEFDGIDDYVDAGNVFNPVQSVAFWMNTATTTVQMGIIGLDINKLVILNSSGQVATDFPGATYYVDGVRGSRIIPDTKWHHVVATASSGFNASAVTIGLRIGTSYFGGILDDVRLYNRTLSAEEVKRLYQHATQR